MSKAKRSPAPGQVWWCEGGAIGFEWRFKTRPVLVVAETEGGEWLVMPLSSKRRFGQEPRVTHGGKISYMTSQKAVVAPSALLSYSGDWNDFSLGKGEAPPHAPTPFFLWKWLRRLFRRR